MVTFWNIIYLLAFSVWSTSGIANKEFRRTEIKPQQPWMMHTVRYCALLSHLKCHVCCITWVHYLKSHTITLLISWLVILKVCSMFTAILNILYCIFFSLPDKHCHWSHWQPCQSLSCCNRRFPSEEKSKAAGCRLQIPWWRPSETSAVFREVLVHQSYCLNTF